ncbi:ATP-binding protein [Streptomyces sp. NPDC012888]|uniref:ATP-binding protein n=1 Tax=Streptomyces sp. NPDC012888 TaxID=3364855 RepID=UPI0036792687
MDRTQGHGGEQQAAGGAAGSAAADGSGATAGSATGGGAPAAPSRPAGTAAAGPATAPAAPALTPPATSAPAAPAGPAAGGGGGSPAARVVRLTAGAFALTVNPVDGSEIEAARPGDVPDRRPAKRDAAARAALAAAALPPVPPGPEPLRLPLLDREEERERLVRLLGRGRSVRLTGPSGSGRTVLLDAVAEDCGALAPDGVVRLSGLRQNTTELLHALYAAVYDVGQRRPGRDELLAGVREIGAIVLLDDLELGGSALDELLHATPECAFLLAATPDTPAPGEDSHLEEVFLTGLGRTACADLLRAAAGRALTGPELQWADDLRFASEGLPLRFVQAGALLRQCDELNRIAEESADEDSDEPGVFEERRRDPETVPLPTLAEAAAPAELLAARAGETARAALRFAIALGGEVPHHAHLPALVGDTHADTAVAELLACGLLTPAGPRYRLAAGVARQLAEAGWEPVEEARTAARHYAWWTGHASVTPGRVATEADAVLASLAGADVVAGVMLARTAAPAFAASLHWGAWERVLRAGAEAARTAGEVAEQAYFHHELGVLALCAGRLDRARAELEASIGLRGALADRHGTVAGRRALALVTDQERGGAAQSPPLRLQAPADGTAAAPALPAAGSAGTGAGSGSGSGSGQAQSGTPASGTPGSATSAPAGSGSGTAGSGVSAAGAPTTRMPAPGTPGSAIPGSAIPGGGRAATAGPGTGAAGQAFPAPRAAAAAEQAAERAPGGEAVTQIVPLLKAGGDTEQPPRSGDPLTLAEAFEQDFKMTPAAAPAPPARPKPRLTRRDPVVLAGAAVLVVALLGTAVSLTLTSGDASGPAPAPGTGVTGSVSPKNSWNDPAPTPSSGDAGPDTSSSEDPDTESSPGATPSGSPSPSATGTGPAPGPSGSATTPTTRPSTPTGRPSTDPTPTATGTSPTPTASETDEPEPDPTPTETPTQTPTGTTTGATTVPTATGTGTATAP